jgi:hypothetical protein
MQTVFVDIELELPTPAEVEPFEIEPFGPPRHCSIDDSGAATAAAAVIRELDKRYRRDQVQAIAVWIAYLSTQH